MAQEDESDVGARCTVSYYRDDVCAGPRTNHTDTPSCPGGSHTFVFDSKGIVR